MYSNEDRYSIALRSDPLEAAELALEFADGCSSHARTDYWTNNAIAAAAQAGVTLDKGDLSWPDTDAMRRQIAASRGERESK